MNKNNILLKYRNKIIITPYFQTPAPQNYLATVLKNIEALGFVFSPDVMKCLLTFNKGQLGDFYKEIVPVLQEATGANRTYEPMYPNFPRQVMEASDAELYMNAMCHYLGDVFGVRVLPQYDKEVRTPLFEDTKPTVIDVAQEGDFENIFTNLMSSKTSLSEDNKADLVEFIKEYTDSVVWPETIPHKENVATVVVAALEANADPMVIASLPKTATDVLRIATQMSGGDVSLAENTRFRNFRRAERRFIMNSLNKIGNISEDLARHEGKWVRLAERIHPGEFKKMPKLVKTFQTLREGKLKTFNSEIETLIANGEISAAVDLLVTRPGDLARRLDKLLRSNDTTLSITESRDKILSAWTDVASKVSTPILHQIKAHFKNRAELHHRAVMPKGNTAKLRLLEKTLPQLPKRISQAVVNITDRAILANYAEKGPMGKVYVDPALDGYLVPYSQRSASKSFKTLVRGSHIPLGDKDTVRFFIWWHDGPGPVDIDLSAVFYDDNWKECGHVGWTNLREGYAGHSGDITSAPNGACEFIDINIPKALKSKGNARYIAMTIHSYTGQSFEAIQDCSAGWMMRDEAQAGEIFDAKTVQHRIDVTANSRNAIPLFIDMLEREVIWADLASTRLGSGHGTYSTSEETKALGQAIVDPNKPKLVDLIISHVEARNATLVDTPEEADVVFSETEGITPYDFDTIVGEYL